MSYAYSAGHPYPLLQSSPAQSSSESINRATPSPPPSSNSFQYLPPLPIPSPSSYNNHNHTNGNKNYHHKNNNNNNTNHFHRHPYPTSSPYGRPQQTSPDPSPSSKSRLPPITSSFTNGYASPATSSYSSEPGSRDEIDMMEPGSLGGSSFHGGHVNLPGVDGIMLRGDNGMHIDDHNPRNEDDCHRPWNMKDFTLVQTVGTGTFGRVFLARFSAARPNRPEFFALKILSKAECVRLRQVEHVNSEREILASVHHPFIVDMFLTFQTPSNLFMCLEYMVGGELFSHLRKEGRFVPDVAKFYAASIVLALEYLHENDIIYRDLKPENLLLDHKGYIKIIDFGFSKRCPDRTWTVCGTPEYLAPEIIRSDGHGKAVDWWALGILTYEMLVGYPPYYDSYPLGIYEKILAGNLSFPSFIDPAAKDLIRQLLRPDLSSRLGNLRGGAKDVKDHLWFRYSDWDSLLHIRFKAPFVPRARWAGDAQYFERYDELSREETENLMNEAEGCGEDFGDMFEGF